MRAFVSALPLRRKLNLSLIQFNSEKSANTERFRDRLLKSMSWGTTRDRMRNRKETKETGNRKSLVTKWETFDWLLIAHFKYVHVDRLMNCTCSPLFGNTAVRLKLAGIRVCVSCTPRVISRRDFHALHPGNGSRSSYYTALSPYTSSWAVDLCVSIYVNKSGNTRARTMFDPALSASTLPMHIQSSRAKIDRILIRLA